MSQGTGLVPTMTGSLVIAADPALSIRLQSNFASLAMTPNHCAVAAALDAGGNTGAYGAGGVALLTNLIENTTLGSVPAVFTFLSGEGLTRQQQGNYRSSWPWW